MKKIAIILVLMLLSLQMIAKDKAFPRLTYGVEWSYIATVFSAYHHNFFDHQDGYRVNIYDSRFKTDSNGEVLLHVGYNLNSHWNISAYTGLTGLIDYHNAVPFNIRATRYFGDNPLNDRWFTYIEGGSGLSVKRPLQAIATAKTGGGYRISLSRDTKIDFHAAVRGVYTQPDIYYHNEKIWYKDINRNDALLLSASFGISLIF